MLRLLCLMSVPMICVISSNVIADNPPTHTQRRIEFTRDVQPILVKSCLSCHGPEKQRGGLRLDRKLDALAGGDSGVVILPQKAAESTLIRLVSAAEPDRLMPPKGERLTAGQIGILRAWIDQGAIWPGADDATDARDWWSLKPLVRPKMPGISVSSAKASNVIDAFIHASLREKGMMPSPQADRRTLIRRLHFDLIGLPPTPEEVASFEKDPSPDAYEKLVDRLLASPHRGERWARHWLDVVHYGDTHGYDKDQPRPNAWPYRDYVIRSFNEDKSYGRFVQEQVAGDVLFPGTVDGTTALGFIAAGPWDLIGHAEVPETKLDGKVARHLDRDDMIATTMNTFTSLTVQCAQCHNHKFDPILQADYYRLQAVFAALDRADRPYHTDPASAKAYAELFAKRTVHHNEQKSLEDKVKVAGGTALAELDRKIAAANSPATLRAEYGYHSGIATKQDSMKWVQLDLGKSVKIDRIIIWGCHDTFNNIGAGFGFPSRYKIEASDDATFSKDTAVIANMTSADVANPGVSRVKHPASVTARYLRIIATKLAPRQNDYIFALAEVEVLDADGKNLATGATISALDSIEAPVRWRKSNLVDGYAPGQVVAGELTKLQAERQALVARLTDDATAKSLATIALDLTRIEAGLAKVQPAGRVYAGTIHTGAGSFRGTGPEGKPRPIYVLRRGDIKNPMQEVTPGTLSVVKELSGDFSLPSNHTEGERRVALAKWITDTRNPLTWRSIVNRVWQYHFGRGIVATPNDFGRMGQLPTHPELLDWLAVEFRDNGQSIKKLHKLIVTSATYQQSSNGNEQYEKLDAGNAYLWRMTRRKLEAEAIHDATLAVAGKLDRTMYGPAYRDFVVEHPAHSPHYEYHLHDPNDPKSHRRSIYRFLVRSKPSPFMTVLDCADPSMQVDKRTETLSPLQALALFNNGLMLVMSKHLASRVEKESDPVTSAFRLALGRSPTAVERNALQAHATEHGLANACRVILNLNEFAFVD